MAHPGERRFVGKIWDDLIDHVANAFRVTGTGGGGAITVNQGAPGTPWWTRPSAIRGPAVLHRSAITVADVIANFGAGSVSLADNGAGTGSLTQSTTYYATAVPGNRYGSTVAPTIDSIVTGAYGANTGSIRMTIAQATGPNGAIAEWYDLFLSIDAAPKWVARVTEAQRAAGDYEVTAVGVVAAGGGNPAGTIDVNVAGTGIQTTAAPFIANNAFTPNVASGLTPIDCTGFTLARIQTRLVTTDLRSLPSLVIAPFFENEAGVSGAWHQGELKTVQSLNGSQGSALYQEFEVQVAGSTGLVVLVAAIGGQGAAASLWVSLA